MCSDYLKPSFAMQLKHFRVIPDGLLLSSLRTNWSCKVSHIQNITVLWYTVRNLLNVLLRHYLSFSLSMHLLLWMNGMLDCIWTLPVQLWGTRNKWTLQKISFQVGFEPSHGKETSLLVHRLNRSATTRFLWMKKLNVHLMSVNMYIHTIYK